MTGYILLIDIGLTVGAYCNFLQQSIRCKPICCVSKLASYKCHWQWPNIVIIMKGQWSADRVLTVHTPHFWDL